MSATLPPLARPTRESVAADVASAEVRGDYAAARDLDRFGSLAVMLNEFAARNAIAFRNSWRDQARIGFAGNTRGGYTVTGRGTGYAVVTLADGQTETIYAPTPYA